LLVVTALHAIAFWRQQSLGRRDTATNISTEYDVPKTLRDIVNWGSKTEQGFRRVTNLRLLSSSEGVDYLARLAAAPFRLCTAHSVVSVCSPRHHVQRCFEHGQLCLLVFIILHGARHAAPAGL